MVAYFSMEIALEPAMPTYAGGLGVLAGDFVRAAADLGVPMVAVTLLHRKGYIRQRLDSAGRQQEEPLDWPVETYVRPLPARITLSVAGRDVVVRAWERTVTGWPARMCRSTFLIPIFLKTRRRTAR
jgi:starch phosphorylase